MKEGTNRPCVRSIPQSTIRQRLSASNITLLSMDMIPRRLSRAQSMDVNQPRQPCRYKAVLLGAAHVPKGIPMMTTSAGTVRPAKVVIMGPVLLVCKPLPQQSDWVQSFMHPTYGNQQQNRSNLLVVDSSKLMEWTISRMKLVMQSHLLLNSFKSQRYGVWSCIGC